MFAVGLYFAIKGWIK